MARSDIELAAALGFDLLRRNARDLSHPARALLQQMWRLANGTGRPLARREIQNETGLTYWHLRVYLRELVEHEWVEVVRGNARGSRYAYAKI